MAKGPTSGTQLGGPNSVQWTLATAARHTRASTLLAFLCSVLAHFLLVAHRRVSTPSFELHTVRACLFAFHSERITYLPPITQSSVPYCDVFTMVFTTPHDAAPSSSGALRRPAFEVWAGVDWFLMVREEKVCTVPVLPQGMTPQGTGLPYASSATALAKVALVGPKRAPVGTEPPTAMGKPRAIVRATLTGYPTASTAES